MTALLAGGARTVAASDSNRQVARLSVVGFRVGRNGVDFSLDRPGPMR